MLRCFDKTARTIIDSELEKHYPKNVTTFSMRYKVNPEVIIDTGEVIKDEEGDRRVVTINNPNNLPIVLDIEVIAHRE